MKSGKQIEKFNIDKHFLVLYKKKKDRNKK